MVLLKNLKQQTNQRLAEIEKKGEADPLVEAKLSKNRSGS